MTVSALYGNDVSNIADKQNATLIIKSMLTSDTVEFPAFLTSFNQSFSSTWNEEEVYGRMDPIATYQGTKRTMSLGFDLPAGSLGEAKDNLDNCSMLTKMVYPVYSTEGGSNNHIVSKPPLVRIKFANLFPLPFGKSVRIQIRACIKGTRTCINHLSSAMPGKFTNSSSTARININSFQWVFKTWLDSGQGCKVENNIIFFPI